MDNNIDKIENDSLYSNNEKFKKNNDVSDNFFHKEHQVIESLEDIVGKGPLLNEILSIKEDCEHIEKKKKSENI